MLCTCSKEYTDRLKKKEQKKEKKKKKRQKQENINVLNMGVPLNLLLKTNK